MIEKNTATSILKSYHFHYKKAFALLDLCFIRSFYNFEKIYVLRFYLKISSTYFLISKKKELFSHLNLKAAKITNVYVH